MPTSFLDGLAVREKQHQPLLVAEIGAKYAALPVLQDMVRSARACGADYVKFQTYKADTISAPGATFTMNDGRILSQFDYFKSTELSQDEHRQLDATCRAAGVGWFSTPSHESDLDLLEPFQLPAYKTGSDDLTNLRFLRAIARKNRPMIVSTGMSTLGEVEKAVRTIVETGNRQLVLLHCVVSYPSRIQDANLRVIETLRQAFGVPIGLSDHTTDEFTSVLATQIGVCMIEKHFTLDHALKLPDHEASLDPSQFKRFVERVRLVPEALGHGLKSIAERERNWRKAARKSVFALHHIVAGQVITEEDLAIRRPADGLAPDAFDRIVGARAKEDIPAGSLLAWNMLHERNSRNTEQ